MKLTKNNIWGINATKDTTGVEERLLQLEFEPVYGIQHTKLLAAAVHRKLKDELPDAILELDGRPADYWVWQDQHFIIIPSLRILYLAK